LMPMSSGRSLQIVSKLHAGKKRKHRRTKE
jgi:hypothetical protein